MSAAAETRATAALAEYVATADLRGLEDEAVELTRRSLVDTLGVMVAARGEPGLRILAAAAGGGAGAATVFADGSTASPERAALLNGLAGHALDFDDVSDHMYGHPSVVLWPAILAVAETIEATEREVVEAFGVGFTTIAAVAAAMDVREHYGRGWHSTATLGVLGATAAVARLRRLDADAARRALGLAVSMAGGSRQNFGTMTKPLHVGLAARDAVFAAALAAGGFTADPSILDGPLGFYAMFAGAADPGAAGAVLAGPSALLAEGLNVKKYPCCYNTHRTADAILELVGRHAPRPEAVRAVRLTLEPGGFDPLIHHRPTSGLQGKFSAEYVIAAGLLDGRIQLATFTDEAVMRAPARRLIELVETAESERPPFGDAAWDYAYAAIELTTGEDIVTSRVDIPRGDRRMPLERAALEDKLRDCVAYAGADWDVDGLLRRLWSFGSPDRPFRGFPEVSPASTRR